MPREAKRPLAHLVGHAHEEVGLSEGARGSPFTLDRPGNYQLIAHAAGADVAPARLEVTSGA